MTSTALLWNIATMLALMAVAAVIEVIGNRDHRSEPEACRPPDGTSVRDASPNYGVGAGFHVRIRISRAAAQNSDDVASSSGSPQRPVCRRHDVAPPASGRSTVAISFYDDSGLGTRATRGGNRRIPAGFEGKRHSGTRQYPPLASTRSSRFSHLVHAGHAQGASFQRAGGNRHQLRKHLFHL